MTSPLIFDNSPLSHFARAGRLVTLEQLVAGRVCLTTSEVRSELLSGTSRFPQLLDALRLPWLSIVDLDDMAELAAFAAYKVQLGGGLSRNVGEATVLAWAKVNGGIVVMDERAGSRLAQRDGIEVHGTLWLVVHGLRNGVLDREQAESLVDELIATDLRLPVDGRGLFAWAFGEGLLP